MPSTDALGSIIAVFRTILDWFVDSLESVSTMFYADGDLIFIGIVTLVGVGIAIATMIVASIRSLLRLK